METTNVSEITIIPIKPKNGLVALASCVVDDKLYLGSIGIYTKLKGGYRLTYPNKKVGENAINLYHPITRECGDNIEQAIIDKYEGLMSQGMDN